MDTPANSESAVNKEKMNEMLAYMKSTADLVNNAIEEYLNNESSPRNLEKLLGKSGYQFDSVSIQKAIIEPSKYILQSGGKRLRPFLMLNVIEAFGKNPNDYLEFSIIPEIIHTGTLVHDDIEDNSDFRRGREAVHKKYGIDVALNLGDFLFYFPIVALLDSKKISRSVKTKILEIYQRDMLRLGIGQGTEIAWHRCMTEPTQISENEYMQMAYSKTGVLSAMAAKIGAALGGATKRQINMLGKFGATMGIAFQLQDDILNITESSVSASKGGLGDDISEGKITLLVIHALSKLDESEKKRLIEILNMHTNDSNLKSEAIGLIKKSGAIDYANKKKEELVAKCIKELDKAIPDSQAKERLKLIAYFAMSRSN